MQSGNTIAMDVLLILTLSSFHFCTLEEYYTGGLFLPPFNAISDGSFMFIGAFIYCGLFGNEWSQQLVYKDVKGVDAFVYASILINLFVILCNIKGIFDHQKKKINYDPITNTGDITGEILVVKDLAGQIIGYVLTMSLLLGIYTLTSHSFEVMVLQCLLMQHLTCSVQVNHVSKKKYSPWKNRVNLFLMVSSIVTYFGYMADPFFYPHYYTRFMLLVTVVAEWHYILNVIYEMANALEIRVLFVKSK
jgi:hypothetical protein